MEAVLQTSSLSQIVREMKKLSQNERNNLINSNSTLSEKNKKNIMSSFSSVSKSEDALDYWF